MAVLVLFALSGHPNKKAAAAFTVWVTGQPRTSTSQDSSGAGQTDRKQETRVSLHQHWSIHCPLQLVSLQTTPFTLERTTKPREHDT